jgi:hypothetical protein
LIHQQGRELPHDVQSRVKDAAHRTGSLPAEWALNYKTADVLREFHKRKAASHASFQHIPLFYRKPTMAGAKVRPMRLHAVLHRPS